MNSRHASYPNGSTTYGFFDANGTWISFTLAPVQPPFQQTPSAATVQDLSAALGAFGLTLMNQIPDSDSGDFWYSLDHSKSVTNPQSRVVLANGPSDGLTSMAIGDQSFAFPIGVGDVSALINAFQNCGITLWSGTDTSGDTGGSDTGGSGETVDGGVDSGSSS